MEHIGLGGNPGIGLTVPREPKQVLEETLQRHLGLGQGASAERSLAPGENAISRVTTPARPQSSVGLL